MAAGDTRPPRPDTRREAKRLVVDQVAQKTVEGELYRILNIIVGALTESMYETNLPLIFPV